MSKSGQNNRYQKPFFNNMINTNTEPTGGWLSSRISPQDKDKLAKNVKRTKHKRKK